MGVGREHAVRVKSPSPSPLPFREVSIGLLFFPSLMQPAPFIREHPEVAGSTCSYLKAELLSSDQHTENRPRPLLPDSHWIQLRQEPPSGSGWNGKKAGVVAGSDSRFLRLTFLSIMGSPHKRQP